MVGKWLYLVCEYKGLFKRHLVPVKMFTAYEDAKKMADELHGKVYKQAGAGKLTLCDD